MTSLIVMSCISETCICAPANSFGCAEKILIYGLVYGFDYPFHWLVFRSLPAGENYNKLGKAKAYHVSIERHVGWDYGEGVGD